MDARTHRLASPLIAPPARKQCASPLTGSVAPSITMRVAAIGEPLPGACGETGRHRTPFPWPTRSLARRVEGALGSASLRAHADMGAPCGQGHAP